MHKWRYTNYVHKSSYKINVHILTISLLVPLYGGVYFSGWALMHLLCSLSRWTSISEM